MTRLRSAQLTDIDFLLCHPARPTLATVAAQIQDGHLRIIEMDGEPIGFIKFYTLWEDLPFLEVIYILPPRRKFGFGRDAVRLWEAEMAELQFDFVLTSTRSDEDAQHFWRHIGYVDCGTLTWGGNPSEIFMQRTTRTNSLSERPA